jgi:hypothetical protein
MAEAGWEGASTDGNADASGGSAMVKVCTNMVDMSAILADVSVPADGAWIGVLLKAGPSTAVRPSIGALGSAGLSAAASILSTFV